MPRRLPRTQVSRDSVGLEIATVSLPANGQQILNEITRELDELVMEPQRRRLLNRNGLTCGLLSSQLPKCIHQLLLEAENDRAHPTAETVARGLEVQRFLQCRAGRAYDVSLAMPPRDQMLTYFDADAATEDVYESARCLFTMRCLLKAGSAISLEFTPEVEHGPLRQKWVSKGGTFHAESGRDRKALDRLRMTLNVRPGETVLITGRAAAGNTGANFFVHPETKRQRILLVRLAQTHTQDLYPSEELAPLTTTGE